MLKFLVLVLSIAFVSALMCVDSILAVDAGDIVAYWSFDKGSGGTVIDDSGNEHDGEVMGAEWTDEGKSGKAMSFDGVGAFVNVASNPGLEPEEDDWTIELWLKRADAAGGWHKILTKYPGSWNGYRIGLLDSSVHVIFGTGQANMVEFATQTKIQDQEWHHLALVVDRAGDAVIYIDGEPDVTTANVEHIGAVATTQNLEIGRCHWCDGGATMGFNGILDEIKIWRAALTPDEVELAMNGELGTAVEYNGELATTWGKIKVH